MHFEQTIYRKKREYKVRVLIYNTNIDKQINL